MVLNSAIGIDTAQAGTGVLALPRNTGHVGGTVRVDYTFRPAVWWGPYHIRETRALASFSYLSRRITVGATRVGITGINLLDNRGLGWLK